MCCLKSNNQTSDDLLAFETNSIYQNSLDLLDELQIRLRSEVSQLSKFDFNDIKNIDSNIDIYDFLFAAVFGLIGSIVSSSELVKSELDFIHTDASKSEPSTILGKLLNHKGDAIDKIDGKFIKRDGSNADLMFHRLFWGHDPLSFGKDNPFFLMKQSSSYKTVFCVFQHLVGDTFSKQGLPLPFHSHFDFTDSDKKLSNSFIEISKSLSKNNRIKTQDVFSRLFTIRAQDILSQGFVWAACKGYSYARSIEDNTRIRQIRIISYSTNFFAHAAIGALRQGGIPYINWITLVAIIKELAGLYLNSYEEIGKLEKITNSIIKKNVELEKQIFSTGRGLVSHKNSSMYINEIYEQERSTINLIDFFEGV